MTHTHTIYRSHAVPLLPCNVMHAIDSSHKHTLTIHTTSAQQSNHCSHTIFDAHANTCVLSKCKADKLARFGSTSANQNRMYVYTICAVTHKS